MCRGADRVVIHGQVVADAPHDDLAGMQSHPNLRLDPVVTALVDQMVIEIREQFGVTSVVVSHVMARARRIAGGRFGVEELQWN